MAERTKGDRSAASFKLKYERLMGTHLSASYLLRSIKHCWCDTFVMIIKDNSFTNVCLIVKAWFVLKK